MSEALEIISEATLIWQHIGLVKARTLSLELPGRRHMEEDQRGGLGM